MESAKKPSLPVTRCSTPEVQQVTSSSRPAESLAQSSVRLVTQTNSHATKESPGTSLTESIHQGGRCSVKGLTQWLTARDAGDGRAAKGAKSGSATPASLSVRTEACHQSPCPQSQRVAAKHIPSAATMQEEFGISGPDLLDDDCVPETGEVPSLPRLKVEDALLRPKATAGARSKGPKQGTAESRFKRWLLTLNGSQLELDDVRQHLLEEWPALCQYIIIAREKTAAGNIHMHAFLYLKDRLSPKKIKTEWPWIDGCNFKPVGEETTYNVVQYVKKQGDWEEYGAERLATHGGPPDGPQKRPFASK